MAVPEGPLPIVPPVSTDEGGGRSGRNSDSFSGRRLLLLPPSTSPTPVTRPVSFDQDEEVHAVITYLFECLDFDGSGYLEAKELERACQVMLGKVVVGKTHMAELTERLPGLLGSIDVNRDGRVDKDEWCVFSRGVFEIVGRNRFMIIAGSWALDLARRWLQEPNPSAVNQPKARDGNGTGGDADDSFPKGAAASQSLPRMQPSCRSAGRGSANAKAADAEKPAVQENRDFTSAPPPQLPAMRPPNVLSANPEKVQRSKGHDTGVSVPHVAPSRSAAINNVQATSGKPNSVHQTSTHERSTSASSARATGQTCAKAGELICKRTSKETAYNEACVAEAKLVDGPSQVVASAACHDNSSAGVGHDSISSGAADTTGRQTKESYIPSKPLGSPPERPRPAVSSTKAGTNTMKNASSENAPALAESSFHWQGQLRAERPSTVASGGLRSNGAREQSRLDLSEQGSVEPTHNDGRRRGRSLTINNGRNRSALPSAPGVHRACSHEPSPRRHDIVVDGPQQSTGADGIQCSFQRDRRRQHSRKEASQVRKQGKQTGENLEQGANSQMVTQSEEENAENALEAVELSERMGSQLNQNCEESEKELAPRKVHKVMTVNDRILNKAEMLSKRAADQNEPASNVDEAPGEQVFERQEEGCLVNEQEALTQNNDGQQFAQTLPATLERIGEDSMPVSDWNRTQKIDTVAEHRADQGQVPDRQELEAERMSSTLSEPRRKKMPTLTSKNCKSADVTEASSDMPLVTIDELWELMTTQKGRCSTHLDIDDFLDAFSFCRDAGMNNTLVTVVPQNFDQDVEPEDLSLAEVAHLCSLLVEDSTLSEQAARDQIANVKLHCRDAVGNSGKWSSLGNGEHLNIKQFRNLFRLLPALLRMDQVYIVAQLAWYKTGHFEMTEVLAALIMERCSVKRCHPGAQPAPVANDACSELVNTGELQSTFGSLEDSSNAFNSRWPDLRVLKEVFTLNDFSKLIHACSVIDWQQTIGISWVQISGVFFDTLRKKQQLIQARSDARPALKRSPTSGSSLPSRGSQRRPSLTETGTALLPTRKRRLSVPDAPMSRRHSDASPQRTSDTSFSRQLSDASPRQRRPSFSGSQGSSNGSPTPAATIDGARTDASFGMLGRTEFSILMEALCEAMPKTNFSRSPLELCLALLQRAQHASDDGVFQS